MLYKNSIVELEITDIDYEGLGIAHLDEYTIFVRDALIGEKVKSFRKKPLVSAYIFIFSNTFKCAVLSLITPLLLIN